MYRKLVFVLTMFAVAFGSLSGVQAALASSRLPARVASAAHAGTPASIAALHATGAVRAATAGRQMAHRTRLRTEERQGSQLLGGDRRATETASAPTNTSGLPIIAAPKITSATSTTFTVGQAGTFTVTTTGTLPMGLSASQFVPPLPSGVTFRDNRNGTATLSGTPGCGHHRNVHVHDHRHQPGSSFYRYPELHPHGQPGMPDHQLCRHHLYRRTRRDLYRHVDRGAQLRTVRDRLTAIVAHVHRQRGRHGDTCGNATYGLRRNLPVHDHRHERRHSSCHPKLHPHGPPDNVYDHQLCRRHLYRRLGRDFYRYDEWGAPLRFVRERRTAAGSDVHRQRERHGGTYGNTGCGLRRTIPVHDHRHEHRRLQHPELHPHGRPGVRDHQRPAHHHPYRGIPLAFYRGVYRHVDRVAHVRIVRDRSAAGSLVHGQRGRHRDILGNTDHPRSRPRSRSLPTTVSVLTPPRPSRSRSSRGRRVRSPAPTTPPSPSDTPGPLPSRRPGCPTAHCLRQAHCRRE